MEVRDSTCGLADLVGGSHFKKGGPEDMLQLSGYHTSCSRLENNISCQTTDSADSVMAMVQWNSALSLRCSWGWVMEV